jgi:hypothetical protein
VTLKLNRRPKLDHCLALRLTLKPLRQRSFDPLTPAGLLRLDRAQRGRVTCSTWNSLTHIARTDAGVYDIGGPPPAVWPTEAAIWLAQTKRTSGLRLGPAARGMSRAYRC